MKKFYVFRTPVLLLIFILLISCLHLRLFAQNTEYPAKSPLTLIGNWPGWKNNPDTVKLFLDSTFTAQEKDSARAAAGRWNAAGGRPAIKVVDEPPADITATTDTTLGDHTPGVTSYTQDTATAEVTGCTVRINNRSGHSFTGQGHQISFTEVFTHELGHTLGLDDTDSDLNPGDCMKQVNSNGTGGQLSKHDSSEVQAAAKFWEDHDIRRAIDQPGVIATGTVAVMTFDLGQAYPDSIAQTAIILVSPLSDPFALPMMYEIVGPLLHVTINVLPQHWSGQLFLVIDITFQDPSYDPVNFLGWQYVNAEPVPPTPFVCPFEAEVENGLLHINWVSSCTYPYPGPVSSSLLVNDTRYFNKGGGDYILNLDPGTYTVTLDVHDFQGNFASSTQTVVVTGLNAGPPMTKDFLIHPNPFSGSCNIITPEGAIVEIFDLAGKPVDRLPGGRTIWVPDPGLSKGIYLFRILTDSGVRVVKVDYR